MEAWLMFTSFIMSYICLRILRSPKATLNASQPSVDDCSWRTLCHPVFSSVCDTENSLWVLVTVFEEASGHSLAHCKNKAPVHYVS